MGFTEDKCDDVRKEVLKRHSIDVEAVLLDNGKVEFTLYGVRGKFYPTPRKWEMDQHQFNGTLMDQMIREILDVHEPKKPA